MNVCEKIDEILLDRGMSRRKLALKAGIPPTTFQSAMARGSNLSLDMLRKIAAALEINVYELLSDEERELFVEGEASVLFHGVGKNYSFSDQEQKLVVSFNKLNQTGQKEAVKRVEEMTKIEDYTKSDDQSDPGKE